MYSGNRHPNFGVGININGTSLSLLGLLIVLLT
jgi:hypothetical protein